MIHNTNKTPKEVLTYIDFRPNKRSPILFIILILVLTSLKILGQTTTQNNSDQITKEMLAKIETTTDPNFIYAYEQSKFVPADDKVLLIMGQTVEMIKEYMDNFEKQPIPGGWSAYWGIPEFKGIIEKHMNDTGTSQHHQMLIDNFPNTAVLSALWMVGNWKIPEYTANGEYDRVIKKYCTWAKSVNRPIYLRIGYEFDGEHNKLEPREYVKAYRHIVDLMRKKGVTNVAFVWHSYAAKPYKDYPISAWYPGDEYVDWVAISVFGHAYNGTDFGPYCDNVLDFAKIHKKPVMIAESNPIHGIDSNSADVWDDWFVNYFSFIYQKNIKAISFINENWPATRIPGITVWKDSRIYNNEQVSQAWFEETNKDRYLKQSKELFSQLGYEKEE